MRERTIATHPKDGGAACRGALKVIKSCNTQVCPDGPDCKYEPWQDWTVCTKCGGQRTRTRLIQAGQENGANCKQDSTKEVQGCSRNCHGNKFCAWGDWTPWASCSATCGSGRQERTRSLGLSDFQPRPTLTPQDSPTWAQQYEALNLEMDARRNTQTQDIAFAFMGGIISFLTLASAMRFCSRSRRPSEESYAEVVSEAPIE